MAKRKREKKREKVLGQPATAPGTRPREEHARSIDDRGGGQRASLLSWHGRPWSMRAWAEGQELGRERQASCTRPRSPRVRRLIVIALTPDDVHDPIASIDDLGSRIAFEVKQTE
jgi:hypothetical protein